MVLDVVEATANQLPEAERLRFAGEALLQIAKLCEARAGLLISEWEQAHRDPRVQQGFFTDLVRQTMAVDLSDLMEPPPPRQPRTNRVKSTEMQEGSVIAVVDKAALLAMVDQLASEAAIEQERQQQVLDMAHDEDVSWWIRAIAQWLQAMPNNQTSFAHLYQSLVMQRVEVWLGVLLGEFDLEPGEEFYTDALWGKAVVVDP